MPPIIFNWLVNLIINISQNHLGESYLEQGFQNWIILYIGWILFAWPWLENITKAIRKDYQTVLKLKLVKKSKNKKDKNNDK